MAGRGDAWVGWLCRPSGPTLALVWRAIARYGLSPRRIKCLRGAARSHMTSKRDEPQASEPEGTSNLEAASDKLGLQTFKQRESQLLARYAMHSVDSLGREHPESEHPYRAPYQRDRDRILHSSAFRRLSGKMQVFTGDMGDYHRTRLTHTYEVASIAHRFGALFD